MNLLVFTLVQTVPHTIATQASKGSRQAAATTQPLAPNKAREQDSNSKKKNFSLKLDKFPGACNDDAKSWLLQFDQYCIKQIGKHVVSKVSFASVFRLLNR